jgi:hypothetical protein
MTLDSLRQLVADGTFHHATYRNRGTLWEGLWIYAKSPDGFRGFSLVGCFPKHSADLDAAYALVRGTGISLSAYGQG